MKVVVVFENAKGARAVVGWKDWTGIVATFSTWASSAAAAAMAGRGCVGFSIAFHPADASCDHEVPA